MQSAKIAMPRTAARRPGAPSVHSMSNRPARTVLLTCEGFAPDDDLRPYARRKGTALLRRLHPRLERLCVHVRFAPEGASDPRFVASATVEKDEIIYVAHAMGPDARAAVSGALRRLERDLLSPRNDPHRAGRLAAVEPISDFLKV